MTPYEVNGTWFDLDHVQGISPVHRTTGPSNRYCFAFGLILTFRTHPYEIYFFYKRHDDEDQMKAESESIEARRKLIAALENKGKQDDE